MSVVELKCPKCHAPLPEAFFGAADFQRCPSCRSSVQCEVFPAFFTRPTTGRAGESLVDAEDASCFFHADKKAAVACESCGRFVCSLCDLDMGGSHICPQCFSSGRRKGTLRDLDHYRTSWAGIALLLALAPILTFWTFVSYLFMPFTAIAALAVAFIGFRKPASVTGRKKIVTFAIAILLALAQIGGSIVAGKSILDNLSAHAFQSEE